MINFNETMFGRQVRFINTEVHKDEPTYYPEFGTIGIIVPVDENSYFDKDRVKFLVKWPKGSTSWSDIWQCDEELIELVDEIVDYTPDKYGAVVAMKLFLVDYHIPYATLAFAFGGTVTVEWDIVENRKKYENGINSYTLVYDERIGNTTFEDRVKIRKTVDKP